MSDHETPQNQPPQEDSFDSYFAQKPAAPRQAAAPHAPPAPAGSRQPEAPHVNEAPPGGWLTGAEEVALPFDGPLPTAARAQPLPKQARARPRQPAAAEKHPPETATHDRQGHDPSGHRARLRRRLMEGGPEALADHELIEYLLTTAIPRRDTKPIARTLLARFGSLAGVFNADPAALAKHPGMGETSAAALHIVAVAARRLARTQAAEKPLLGSWQALLAYLTIDMAYLTVERVRVLYLDTKNRLIRDEHLADGSIDEAAIHPREVIHKGLDLGAAAMILVHNHPSGNPEPSRADIEITRRIADAARHMGLSVLDHVIIGKEGSISLRQKGLI